VCSDREKRLSIARTLRGLLTHREYTSLVIRLGINDDSVSKRLGNLGGPEANLLKNERGRHESHSVPSVWVPDSVIASKYFNVCKRCGLKF
jgi:hypothetical protein